MAPGGSYFISLASVSSSVKCKVGPDHVLVSFNAIIRGTLKMFFVYCTKQGYNYGNVRVERVKKPSKVLPT